MYRIFIFVIGGVALLFGAVAHWSVSMRGFPDGYIPEVGRVLVPYDYAFAYVLLAVGVLSIVEAIRRPNLLPSSLWWSGWVVLAGMHWMRGSYEAYLSSFLMTGAGG